MNIKTLRERDADRLAQRLNPNPTPAEINRDRDAARHALRLFYRFAAAYNNSFYISQNSSASDAEKAAADEKSEKAYKRASEALKPYGVKISCPGLYPIMEDFNGVNFSYGHYYN
jgi:hypothetical protein